MNRRDILSRLGAIALVLGYVWLNSGLPTIVHVIPRWVVYVDGVALIVPIAAAALFGPGSIWAKLEYPVVLAATAVAFVLNTARLSIVADTIIENPAALKPVTLLETSIALWCANIMIFTIAYWIMDGGGPDVRLAGASKYYDFDIPARSDPEKRGPGWQASIVDYLFIAFTTNTAFGPTEALPISARAKSLVMLQSIVSLVTIAGVAARAIGATGS